jgi:ATP-dependent RNA helicase DDX51/DBP6
MRSRPPAAAATATADDSSRSSPVPSSSSSPVSSPPEPEPPTDPQSILDHRTRTPASPPPSLPLPLQRFPLPSRPHAPEKSELASQGLDRALASAQLVDPLLSTPLSLEDENGDDVSGLSARTLKRLRDLGIVELFAGVLLLCRFRRPTVLTEFVQFSPDHTAALAPTSRTSEALSVPPV